MALAVQDVCRARLSPSPPGTARRSPAARSCCGPNRGWATRCSLSATPKTCADRRPRDPHLPAAAGEDSRRRRRHRPGRADGPAAATVRRARAAVEPAAPAQAGRARVLRATVPARRRRTRGEVAGSTGRRARTPRRHLLARQSRTSVQRAALVCAGRAWRRWRRSTACSL